MPLPASIETADVTPRLRRLEGKRALITGAARGIGRATAEALAREGALCAVHARTEAKLEACLAGLKAAGAEGIPVTGDLTDPDAIARLCETTLRSLGGIDIVVNNAGVAAQVDVRAMDVKTWDWTFETNVRAPFLITSGLLPAMIAQGTGGAFLYNASTAARQADAGRSAYNASKAALVSFCRCLAVEVGPHGITANAVCAGWIATEMAAEIHQEIARQRGQDFAAVFDAGMRVNAMGAIIPPGDVAELFVYLASPAARYITGQTVNICAGRNMY